MQYYALIFQEITQFSNALPQKCCFHNISMQNMLGRVCHHICRLDETCNLRRRYSLQSIGTKNEICFIIARAQWRN